MYQKNTNARILMLVIMVIALPIMLYGEIITGKGVLKTDIAKRMLNTTYICDDLTALPVKYDEKTNAITIEFFGVPYNLSYYPAKDSIRFRTANDMFWIRPNSTLEEDFFYRSVNDEVLELLYTDVTVVINLEGTSMGFDCIGQY